MGTQSRHIPLAFTIWHVSYFKFSCYHYGKRDTNTEKFTGCVATDKDLYGGIYADVEWFSGRVSPTYCSHHWWGGAANYGPYIVIGIAPRYENKCGIFINAPFTAGAMGDGSSHHSTGMEKIAFYRPGGSALFWTKQDGVFATNTDRGNPNTYVAAHQGSQSSCQ